MKYSKFFNLKELDGKNGFKISYSELNLNYQIFASQVTSIDNFKGDNFSSVVVGTGGYNDKPQGEIYVIFGANIFSSKVDVANLSGKGITIKGPENVWQFGAALSGVPDMNGDGLGELLIGSRTASVDNKAQSGQVSVVFGSSAGFPSTVTDLNGLNGFNIDGIEANDLLGYSVSGLRDINGDGLGDIIISAMWSNEDRGSVYVIFGTKFYSSATFDLTSLDGSNGFSVIGLAPGDYLGSSVSDTYDANGDGLGDIIIGAMGNGTSLGKVYVIFGNDKFASRFDLNSLNGANGFVIESITADYAIGFSVSGVPDINGDGLSEIALGGGDPSTIEGQSYLIFGNKQFTTPFSLDSLDGINGFKINTGYGTITSSTNNINGNKLGDIIISGIADAQQKYYGQASVIFGSDNVFNSTFFIDDLNGSNGFIINGTHEKSLLGTTISGIIDINGDNLGDLIIGSTGDLLNEGQSAYVIFGQHPEL